MDSADFDEQRPLRNAAFDAVHAKLLVNQQASRRAISGALAHFRKQMLQRKKAAGQERDVLVVFLAGHGVIDLSDGLYFLNHDLSFQNMELTGLAFRDLGEWVADVPAEGTRLPVSQRVPAGVVGQPLQPGGAEGPECGGAAAFLADLRAAGCATPVLLWDERASTATAKARIAAHLAQHGRHLAIADAPTCGQPGIEAGTGGPFALTYWPACQTRLRDNLTRSAHQCKACANAFNLPA